MYQNNELAVQYQLPHVTSSAATSTELMSQVFRDVNSYRRFESTAILLTVTVYELRRRHIKHKTLEILNNTSTKTSNLTNTQFLVSLNRAYKNKRLWRHMFYLVFSAVQWRAYKICKQQTHYSLCTDLYIFLHRNVGSYPCLTTEDWLLCGIAQSVQWLSYRLSSRLVIPIFLAGETDFVCSLTNLYRLSDPTNLLLTR